MVRSRLGNSFGHITCVYFHYVYRGKVTDADRLHLNLNLNLQHVWWRGSLHYTLTITLNGYFYNFRSFTRFLPETPQKLYFRRVIRIMNERHWAKAVKKIRVDTPVAV